MPRFLSNKHTNILILCLLADCAPLLAEDETPIPVHALKESSPATGARFQGAFEFYLGSEDSLQQVLHLQDESWTPVNTKDINQGYTDSILWIRVPLENTENQPIRIILEEDFTLIRSLDAYLVRSPGLTSGAGDSQYPEPSSQESRALDSTSSKSGDGQRHAVDSVALDPGATGLLQQASVDRSRPFAERRIHFYNPTVSLSIPPGETELYVRIRSDMDMISALQLWSPEAFAADILNRQIVFGVLYGSVLLMFLYNAILWLSLRDKAYLFYSLYCLAFNFYFLAYYGHGAQFLWGHWPWFELRAVPIVMSVHIGLLASEFFRLFLSIDASTPVQLRIIRGIQIFSLGLLLGTFLLPPHRSILIFPVYAIASILIMAGISIVRYRQGFKPALFAMVAFLILWVAGIGSSLRSLGVVPYNNATMYGVAFGNVAELLLLSLGLGYRLRKMQEEGRDAGHRSQSLIGVLQGLPYALVLRNHRDRSLLFANQMARSMYSSRPIPDWRRDGIQAFRNGRDRWISVHTSGLEIRGQKADLQIHRDITSEMESRLELEEKHSRTLEAKKQADANRAAQDEFLQSITVEIRKPMAAVMQAADILHSISTGSEQKDLSGILLRSSSNLVSLLNDLEDLSRLEAGELKIRKAPFHAAQLFQDILRLFEPAANAKGLRLEFSGDSLPEYVFQDSSRLTQVVSNLIHNAIKFSEKGTISVSAEHRNGFLDVSVQDQGPGIPEEFQSRLFQRFEQLNPNTYRRFGGTGLGLALCKGMVEAMEGRIECQSEPGRGSRFWIHIPAEEVQIPPNRIKVESDFAPAGLTVALLLSGDDPADLLREQLKLEGFRVIPFHVDFDTGDQPSGISEEPSDLSVQPSDRNGKPSGRSQKPKKEPPVVVVADTLQKNLMGVDILITDRQDLALALDNDPPVLVFWNTEGLQARGFHGELIPPVTSAQVSSELQEALRRKGESDYA